MRALTAAPPFRCSPPPLGSSSLFCFVPPLLTLSAWQFCPRPCPRADFGSSPASRRCSRGSVPSAAQVQHVPRCALASVGAAAARTFHQLEKPGSYFLYGPTGINIQSRSCPQFDNPLFFTARWFPHSPPHGSAQTAELQRLSSSPCHCPGHLQPCFSSFSPSSQQKDFSRVVPSYF